MSIKTKAVGLYYKVVMLVLVLIAWIGFALPYLVSAKDDFMVIGGIIITVLAVPGVVVFGIIPIVNNIKKLDEQDQE